MLDVVRGIGTAPAVSKPGVANPFAHKIGFLQHKDVFFSQQSYRAQLTHFLTDVKEPPLVLSYANPDTDSFWNRVAPARHRDVVVLTPVRPQTTEPAAIAEEVPVDDADNLLGTRRFIMHNQVEPPPPEPNEVKLETFAGDKLDPAFAFQLSEAYKHLKLPEEALSWVAEQGQQISIIPTEHPAQAGFHKTEHRLLSAVMKFAAQIAAPLFGLKIENNALQLPNGQSLPLERVTWKNPEGQKVQVYQVRALPDGTWLRLKELTVGQLFPIGNIKAIRQQVANRIDPLEKQGKVRDVPHVAVPVATPVVSPTPEANPFTALSAVTPETSETFLY